MSHLIEAIAETSIYVKYLIMALMGFSVKAVNYVVSGDIAQRIAVEAITGATQVANQQYVDPTLWWTSGPEGRIYILGLLGVDVMSIAVSATVGLFTILTFIINQFRKDKKTRSTRKRK